MSEKTLDSNYWSNRYKNKDAPWDIGYANPSIIDFFKDKPKDAKILVPGSGNAYEVAALRALGFTQVHLLDFSVEPITTFKNKNPEYPSELIHHGDFFEHHGEYDYIVEQTFFCALNPSLRSNYVEQCKKLLKPGGYLVGVLFNAPLNDSHPPFGGCEEEYRQLFVDFSIQLMENNRNAIKPRADRELFILLQKGL